MYLLIYNTNIDYLVCHKFINFIKLISQKFKTGDKGPFDDKRT